MKLFDCYCMFGESSLRPPSYSKTAAELLEVMDFCGIDQALVFHSSMKHGNPMAANKTVLEETRSYSRLHPSWAILPQQTGEQLATPEFIKAMKENKIKALYAFVQEHAYIPGKVVFGELFEELISREIPLLIEPDWPTVYSILGQFPKLTLIAVGHGPHGDDRYFRPLIEKYPNFYIDTSTYLQDGGIEVFCEKYGAERILFSTGYPGNCIGGPILRALRAELRDSERQLICHGNIERILGSVKL